MAVSTITFAQRMDKINSGKTTSWTVPGQGLAELRDERSFQRNSGMKMRAKSTQKKRGPMMYLAALGVGAVSVIAARWIDFTYLDWALAFAANQGVNLSAFLGNIPTAAALAALISVIAMFMLGLGSKKTMPLMATGFLGALFFEGDLVALAPQVYAQFYPPSWIADMVANASLLT